MSGYACTTRWRAERGGVARIAALAAIAVGMTLLVPASARAQAVTGTLLGNVTDSSGAAVPGATVTARETADQRQPDGGHEREPATTSFPSLQNGTYTVEAELQGFKKVVRRTSSSTSTRPSASI